MRYRYLIYGLIVCACGVALLLFDDIDMGLPMVNLILWPLVMLAGAVLLLRPPTAPARNTRRRRGQREARRSTERLAVRDPGRRLIDR